MNFIKHSRLSWHTVVVHRQVHHHKMRFFTSILLFRAIHPIVSTSSNVAFIQYFRHKSTGNPWYRSRNTVEMFTQQLSLENNSQRKSDSKFLDQVEETIQNVFSSFSYLQEDPSRINLEHIPAEKRQALGVAQNLNKRINSLKRNGDCRRCWLQQAHCICEKCPPLEEKGMDEDDREYQQQNQRHLQINSKIDRLFLLTHHKEICLVVDTAKILLSSFPETARLVVGGIGPQYQESMQEMLDVFDEEKQNESMNNNKKKCIVLFPAENSKSFDEIVAAQEREMEGDQIKNSKDFFRYDVIVMDGTWSQAQKLYKKYIPDSPQRVHLTQDTIASSNEHSDSNFKQLRRHPIEWRGE